MSVGFLTAQLTEERWTVPADLPLSEPHRYVFGWRWAPGPVALCIGINPSFGTYAKPDATMLSLRRMLAFNGFGEYMLGNPFARRSKDPRVLRHTDIGPDNDRHLEAMIARAHVLVAAWGRPPSLGLVVRINEIYELLARSGKPIKCFGRTKAGHPRHPLYMPTRATLEDYRQ